MKKQVLSVGIILLFLTSAFAQTNVKIQIDHKLGSENFEFNTLASNNMGHNFEATRCEYYLSGFTLVHDGGQEILIDDVYALVQADQTFDIDLGDHNVTMIESVRFHTGLDADVNHADPAIYPIGHPLALRFPSMHWGWQAGYFFLTIEGFSGSSTDKALQIHSLGDKHYNEIELPMNISASNGAIVLPVTADIARVLENISIDEGLVEHSDKNEAADAMFNMQYYVFSSASTTSEDEASAVQSFEVFPNPNTTGFATVALNLDAADANYQVRVSDVLGKQVFLSEMQRSSMNETIGVPISGVYIVSVLKNGKAVLNKKLVVEL